MLTPREGRSLMYSHPIRNAEVSKTLLLAQLDAIALRLSRLRTFSLAHQ
jgi:hypothetical protein